MFNSLSIHCLTLLIVYRLLIAQVSAADSSLVDFNRDIRPILSDHCYKCHGPDEGARVSELRLDNREGAFADLGGYSPFVAGDASKSEALRRINSEDVEEQMPPPKANLNLSKRDRELLQEWVEQGAEWRDHWAFATPRAHEPPLQTAADTWFTNKIDAFIKVRLDEEGL